MPGNYFLRELGGDRLTGITQWKVDDHSPSALRTVLISDFPTKIPASEPFHEFKAGV